MCSRGVEHVTEHHLIPKTTHPNKKTKREFSSKKRNTTVSLCKACHNFLHSRFGEKELAKQWNSIETLLKHPDVAKFISWIRTKPSDLRVKFDRSKKRRK